MLNIMNMAKMNTCLHSQTCETGLGFSTVLSAAPDSYMRKEIPCYSLTCTLKSRYNNTMNTVHINNTQATVPIFIQTYINTEYENNIA